MSTPARQLANSARPVSAFLPVLLWAISTALLAVTFFLSEHWGLPVRTPLIATVLPLGLILALAAVRPVTAGQLATGVAVGLLLPMMATLPVLGFYLVMSTMMGDKLLPVLVFALCVVQVTYAWSARRNRLFAAPLGQGGLAAVAGFLLPYAAYGGARAADYTGRARAVVQVANQWEGVRTRILGTAVCALRARDEQGAFPESLPPTCQSTLADSAGSGWMISYQLEPGGQNFVVRAVGPVRGPPYAAQIEVDTLGLLMRDHTRRLQDGEAEVSVDGGIDVLRALAKCLTTDARSGVTAAEAVGVAPQAPRPSGECAHVDWAYNRLTADSDGGIRSVRGHRYAARWTDVAARRFEIELRPLVYGGTAIRSFLLDAQDSLHTTAQDRAATRTDKTIPW